MAAIITLTVINTEDPRCLVEASRGDRHALPPHCLREARRALPSGGSMYARRSAGAAAQDRVLHSAVLPLGNPDFGDCATGSVGADPDYHVLCEYPIVAPRGTACDSSGTCTIENPIVGIVITLTPYASSRPRTTWSS
ncbi:hypothetical protein Bbelb_036360 [Branchiostoma belcheri]|nr:hypothetical protein Bbelb_036360 [Branchiostoma belcheri]